MKKGIEKIITFHSLRHTTLTRLYEKTKDIRLVQEVAGHSDISTIMIYTHICGAEIRKAIGETKYRVLVVINRPGEFLFKVFQNKDEDLFLSLAPVPA